MTMSLAPILSATLDPAQREKAEAELKNLSGQNFPQYVGMLCQELVNEGNSEVVRQVASLVIKNSITAKDTAKKEEYASRWIQLDAQVKTGVKTAALQALGTNAKAASNGATQIVQAIAEVELPRNEWPELIPGLLDNVTKTDNVNLRRATLQALGLICEAVDPDILQHHSNPILTAVVSGARKEEPSPDVQQTALNALYTALEFVEKNFSTEGERNYIMTVVCEATRSEALKVQVAAFECLGKIMSLYYDYMKDYMHQALGSLTLWGMRQEKEEIALQAVEFWSTVCEVECDIDLENEEEEEEQPRENFQFARSAVHELVDALWWLMTKKEEDDDEDEWNISMAAATCLSLLAAAAKDSVVPHVLQFVQTHIQSSDWRYKEASVMAFGSIMDGPNPDLLGPLVVQALPVLIGLMKDPVLQVKDTTAWTLGRICEILPNYIQPEYLESFMSTLLAGLQENPRVAANCAWSLMNLGENLGIPEGNADSYVLSPYFETIVLTTNAAAEGAQQDPNLRAGCYEAISSLVTHCAKDCLPTVNKLAVLLLDRLEHTLAVQNQLVNADDKRLHYELQSNLCGLLAAVIRRLGKQIVPIADRTMQALLMVMTSASRASTVMEDAFLAVGSVTIALETDFSRYMDAFTPLLFGCLQNHEEYQMCSIAVGLVGDLSRALNDQITPYCDTLMNILMANLQNPALNKSVKPSILSAFGDIALAIGGHFAAYLDVTMAVLQQAGAMASMTMNTAFDADYGNQLREGIIEAYIGITQGLKGAGKADLLSHHAAQIFGFAQEVATSQAGRSVSVTSSLVGLIGDLAETFPPGQFKPLFSADWISGLLRSVKTDRTMDQDAKNTARWAREMVRRQINV